MEKLGKYGIILLILGIIIYISNILIISSILGLENISIILAEIGYYIFIAGTILMIFHFILRFKNLYKTNKKISDSTCSKCGRIIPIDECICPYCWKDFEDKYKK